MKTLQKTEDSPLFKDLGKNHESRTVRFMLRFFLLIKYVVEHGEIWDESSSRIIRGFANVWAESNLVTRSQRCSMKDGKSIVNLQSPSLFEVRDFFVYPHYLMPKKSG